MIPHRTDQLPVDMDRREGVDIGPYRLLEPIGGGALACVYRAEHRLLGALAAIKILRPVYESEPEARDRLADEARLTSALSHHPNIITAQDFIIDADGRMGLVLELVRGRSLAGCDAPLPIGDVLAIGAQLADALVEIHAAGFVHGDVGPGNVLLTADELGQARAILIDFGLAVAHGERAGSGEGVGAGTPGYRSPEQERGDVLDQRSDLYGFGALLHLLVTGRAPASSEDFRAALVAALSRAPSNPAAADSGRFVVARELEEMVSRCLQPEPADRPSSAAELRERLQALSAILDGALEPKNRLELEILSEPGPLPLPAPASDAYDEIEIEVADDEHTRDLGPASEWSRQKLGLSDWGVTPPRQVGSAVAAISLLLVVLFGLVALMGRAMLVDPALLPGEHAAVETAVETPAVQGVLHAAEGQ